MKSVRLERGESVVGRVLEAVAEAEGCGKLDLPPLFDAVDPEALARIVEHDADVTVSFAYHGYRVEVEGPGTVDVSPV